MELIVVMLISGVTITIAYRGFDIFQHLFLSYRQNGAYIGDVVFFNRVLSEDMSQSSHVYKTEEGISCLREDHLIHYYVYDAFILRNNKVTDTFFIEGAELTCYLLEQEQMETERLIDRVAIQSYHKEDTLYFDVQKIYGADVLMQYEDKKDK
ncbi:MAG: hypothetical protein JWO58_3112 [Chitinophagaceae bacterium]|nr:hypothetical protein [Chitinophagaceae bacterium]